MCGQTRESPGSPEEADMLSATGQRTQSLKQQEHTYTHTCLANTHTLLWYNTHTMNMSNIYVDKGTGMHAQVKYVV